jgi:Zn-dependent alcohol dehydrogenase
MMIINSSHDPSEKHEDIHTMAIIEIIVAWEPAEPQKINLSLEDVDVDMSGEGEVLVEMCAAGICHTDIVLSSVPT